ncbi:MAG TPA: response regulator transcription factor [Saprospiraceae bacterium]|nr:response regulator transcription factor [Saprospiraceae bacterium]
MKITTVIVEDSRLARNELKELIRPFDEIEIIGEAENVESALELMQNSPPQLLFLDINLPGKSGFELLELLDEVPKVVFTTAYDEFAIKSFEYNAFDYLLKPISIERFEKSMEKVIVAIEKERSRSEEKSIHSQIFLKDGDNCWLVKIADLELFEVDGNYTRVFFENHKPMIYKSLQKIIVTLPTNEFFRANRQQVINIRKISKITPWFSGNLKVTMNNGMEIEISRRQANAFKELLSL